VANDNARKFLEAAGWGDAAREPLTGDASARKYVRLRNNNRTAILMDASRLPEIVAPFVRIDEHLRQLGFSAPDILARGEQNSLLLLEDFGDATFAQLLDQPRSSRGNEAQTKIGNRQSAISNELEPPHVGSYNPEQLFTLATDVLIALHRHPQATPEGLRAYSPDAMLADIELFLEVGQASSLSSGQDARATSKFRKVWREVLPIAHRVPTSLLMRDYHAANLMLLPDRAGIRRAGLLDFQDAYQGPITYDLVSLLEDARRDVPEDLRNTMIARYLAQFPSLDRGAFETSIAILAALRHTRVLAIFEKLSREGKTDYKQLHSPRVARLLQTALAHPMLAGVKRWFDEYARQD
jgi:aminoglycoside/choline kinase family phosphotransferase